MLDIYAPKIIAYFIERFLLFLYPSSFPIQSIQEAPILETVIKEILSCLFDTFAVRARYFLLI